MVKKNKAEKWRQIISDYKSSGMTAKEWCLVNGVTKSALYNWMKKLKVESEEATINTKWATLTVPEPQQTFSAPSITLKLKDFTLEIESGFDKAALGDILSVVMKLC